MNKNVAYEASAGSGKTFMLVVRYLSLLFLDVQPGKILTLTFTNKAASEMYERIVATLEELPQRDELQEIAKNLHVSQDEILKKQKKVLTTFLKSTTKIMTIDSFFASILRKFSLYVSLMPDFTTLAKLDEANLVERFLKELQTKREEAMLIELSLETKQRLLSIFSLLEEFGFKQNELRSGSFSHTPLESLKAEAVATVAQMNTLILSCEKAGVHAKNAFVIEEFEEIVQKSWFGRESLEYRTFSKCYTPQLDELLEHLYGIMREYFRAKEGNFFYHLQLLTQSYHKARGKFIAKHNEVSFDDVTHLVYEILSKRIDREFLYFRLDSTIEHILLDEFQDTSILQYKILHPLIEEITSGKGAKEGSFFFVGDVKQSIYRFRGGVSALFYEVAKLNNTTIEKLVTNYRSKEAVVTFVNNTFCDVMPHYTLQKVLQSKKGGYVNVAVMEDVIHGCYESVCVLKEQGAKDEEIAILCATNKDGAAIKEYLESFGLKVLTQTTSKLIHQESVLMVYEYCMYLCFRQEINLWNFQKLSGIKEKPLLADTTKESPLVIVKKMLSRYNLYGGDVNLLRFLEVLGGFDTMEEFLFGFESIEEEAISSTLKGIKVVTIHKSKGLEYPHVIVVDRLSKEVPQRESILYHYKGVELQNIYLRQKGREALDEPYKKALEANKALAYEDKLNSLYVAFTRAKESLFVLQKEKNSTFAPLKLAPVVLGSLEIQQEQDTKKQTKELKSCYKPVYYGSQTNLLEKQKESEQNKEAIEFGLALHYMLEMIDFNKPESLQMAKEALYNRFGLSLLEESLEDITKRAEKLLKYEPFVKLVRHPHTKEQPLRYKKKLFYIDLLVEKKEEYIIVDYKTGNHLHNEYIQQITNYKKAVETITGKKAKGYICYMFRESIELVEV